jgi:hypothetical protein
MNALPPYHVFVAIGYELELEDLGINNPIHLRNATNPGRGAIRCPPTEG